MQGPFSCLQGWGPSPGAHPGRPYSGGSHVSLKCRPISAPGPARVGAVPRGSHYAHLGAAGARARASGRAEALPHARGSRLDVHTELFVYVGASRRTYRSVCLRGSPFGAQKIKSIPPPPPPPPHPLLLIDMKERRQIYIQIFVSYIRRLLKIN